MTRQTKNERREPTKGWTRWKIVRRVVGGALVIILGALLLSPTGCYLSRAGWEEARILSRRQPIPRLVADSATAPSVRAKLRLVLDARQYAQDVLGLKAGQSFTQYSALDRDTLVLVLSAAYRDRLEQYTWWFPIVGRVPYKGYFDFEDAARAARAMSDKGFDTQLRPSIAFSTLGWFNDPLVSTTIEMDSLELANTVIHELTHNTFYASGQAIFNESFANCIGSRGAAAFFRARGQEAAATEVEARWEDDKVLGAFWDEVYHALDSAYAKHPEDREARLAARDSVYAWARGRLVGTVGPRLRTISPLGLERVEMNNAALLARRVYYTDLDVLDAVFEREGRDVRRTVARVTALARGAEDPFAALRVWLASPGSETPAK